MGEHEGQQFLVMELLEGHDELVYQISHLRFAEFRGNVVDREDPQMPIEKRRHLVDALCYVLLDDPRFIEKSKPQPQYDDHNVVRPR